MRVAKLVFERIVAEEFLAHGKRTDWALALDERDAASLNLTLGQYERALRALVTCGLLEQPNGEGFRLTMLGVQACGDQDALDRALGIQPLAVQTVNVGHIDAAQFGSHNVQNIGNEARPRPLVAGEDNRMLMREIKAGVLKVLYATYQDHGFAKTCTGAALEEHLGVEHTIMRSVLYDLKNTGLIKGQEPTGGWMFIQLTPHGVEQVEDPSSPVEWHFVQNVSVSGGNVQIGNGNTQNITYSTVLQNLVEAIAKDSTIPPEMKRSWTEALKGLAAHPLTQTAIQTAATIGAALSGQP